MLIFLFGLRILMNPQSGSGGAVVIIWPFALLVFLVGLAIRYMLSGLSGR